MKNSIYPVLFLALALVSCDKDETRPGSGNNPVQPRSDSRGGNDNNSPGSISHAGGGECDCPLLYLAHVEKISRNSKWTIELTLPSGRFQLLPGGKLAPEGSVGLGSGKGGVDKSTANETLVELGSAFEKADIHVNALCSEWLLLCQAGASEAKRNEWQKKVYRTFGIKTEPDAPSDKRAGKQRAAKPVLPGLSNEVKTVSGLSFTYGYSGRGKALLQVLFEFRKGGDAWFSLHRDDLFFSLPGDGNFSIDLVEVGFERIPPEWDYEIWFITSKQETVVRPFGRRKASP